jgi:hypothetical protein
MAPMPPRPSWQPQPGPPYAPLRPRNEGKAVASLVLGILSVACLGGILTGLPAIVLGSLARRDIDRSQGRLGGSGLAAGGIVSGLFGTGLSLIIAVTMLGGVVGSSSQPTDGRSEAPGQVPVASGTRSYGSLDVVDLDDDAPLRPQLADAVRTATAKGRTVVLQTYVRRSSECAALARALPDPRMQRALAGVTLVRVDVDNFADELHSMHVETDAVPWFYKLDATGRPVDAINGGEWDDNIPANMAPVLGAFVRGTLSSRRYPSPLGTDL